MSFKATININCNEAIAWAATSAGVDFMSHYPGSPVNMVEKHLKNLNGRFNKNIQFNDSLNEHVAALSAAGASFSGAKSLVVMKHVGLNIASDPFNYIGYTGVKGPMVIVVGTDPGANSSTGEEDVHWYVPQFNFPLLEPTSVQECYDFIKKAYAISAKFEIPVLVFVPSRLAYNYATIDVTIPVKEVKPDFYFETEKARYINVGAQAVNNHKSLIQKISNVSESESLVKKQFNPNASIGLITRGLSYSITYEIIVRLGLQDEVELLNMDLVYPINKTVINEFSSNKKELIFIEDQDGFVENQVKMDCYNELPRTINGKNIFPKYGEITSVQITDFLVKKFQIEIPSPQTLTVPELPERLGTFCEGCPHTGSFYSIDTVLKEIDAVIGGDIGCSSLPPFRADWLLCMNAGIGISQGMAQVSKNQTIISTGGDGSFFHAGALSLLSAIQNKIDLIHLVFDNGTIAMTGHQESPTSNGFDHHQFLDSLGVDRVIDVSPYQPKEFIQKLKEEIGQTGVRVFWVKGGCVLHGNEEIERRRNILYPEINADLCGSCTKCYTELACPAIINLKNAPEQELKIDLDRCVRCGTCHEICPNSAITIHPVL